MNLIYILKLILSNNHIQLIKALKNNDYKYAEYILSLKSLPIVPTIILININNIKMYNIFKKYDIISTNDIYRNIIYNNQSTPFIIRCIKEYDKEINLNRALSAASFHGNVNIVKTLIEMGVDINIKRPSNPLLNAVYNNHLEIVQILIDNGAKVDIHIYKAATSLTFVCFQKHIKIKEIINENYGLKSLFTYSLRYVKKNEISYDYEVIPEDIKVYL